MQHRQPLQRTTMPPANMANQLFLGRSMRDGIAFSVMSGADETCLSVYALFLKATSEQVACWLRCRR
jgi:hypothetical protein